MGLEPASVRLLTLSNIEISKTSGPIAIKIYVKIGLRMSKFDIRSQFKCQIRFRMSKYHIRPKFECQNRILNVKV